MYDPISEQLSTFSVFPHIVVRANSHTSSEMRRPGHTVRDHVTAWKSIGIVTISEQIELDGRFVRILVGSDESPDVIVNQVMRRQVAFIFRDYRIAPFI